MTRELLVQRDGAVAILTLARPPHNFFDATMLAGLATAVDEVDRDPNVNSIVLCSNQKNFCAGADFRSLDRPDPGPIYEQAVKLVSRGKPLVAAINGAAVGGGLGLSLAADFRVGDETTRFQANFVSLGISPGFGLSFTLPRLLGAQAARDLLLTARSVKAAEAKAIGLLDRLAAPGELMREALNLAKQISQQSSAAVIATRCLLGFNDRLKFSKAVELELRQQLPLFAAPDFEEGVKANREKRAPVFGNWPENIDGMPG
ncbi:TPA: enoyl-CoA hydratase/isomerase family protein [Burkholderia cepacia]|uniref:enoyl-CoA hydratase/isomerase family protein n=1 Tax=Burkholderia cepacia TaxID=292 RepID=UPI001CF565EF|nr:enoyl-CoA hydratase/isomerase family protein [Burkholderia cepacia]MCA8357604.1 enoyl-CoA hydratase/isomerase family protein [Burkholderia cepacia]HDV6368284.1 enoyl-CoA hydratase/isomerase family protein [Burkholderia cepacia]